MVRDPILPRGPGTFEGGQRPTLRRGLGEAGPTLRFVPPCVSFPDTIGPTARPARRRGLLLRTKRVADRVRREGLTLVPEQGQHTFEVTDGALTVPDHGYMGT